VAGRPARAGAQALTHAMVQSGGALRVYHRTLFRQLVYQAIGD